MIRKKKKKTLAPEWLYKPLSIGQKLDRFTWISIETKQKARDDNTEPM